jgi:ubiquinone/menaquinone biosynthesis C-methylase UbiE
MYSSVEFNFWAYKEESLSPDEEFLIEKYLDKNATTIEAGTGGGRIVSSLEKIGFKHLYAFDYVPGFIEIAKKKNITRRIYFAIEDAVSLTYKDCQFEQLLYLNQIICTIVDGAARLNAFKEAYRILKKGGTAIFSFLNFDSRAKIPFYIPYVIYIHLLRSLTNTQRSIQYLPQLKYGDKTNWQSLLDSPPYMYWYKPEEAYQILKEANFEIVALGSNFQINQGKMHTSLESFKQEPNQGMLYFVCQK